MMRGAPSHSSIWDDHRDDYEDIGQAISGRSAREWHIIPLYGYNEAQRRGMVASRWSPWRWQWGGNAIPSMQQNQSLDLLW